MCITLRRFKIFFLYFIFISTSHGLDSELLNYFRFSQWQTIINFFKKNTPLTKEHNYLYAKALEKEKTNNTQPLEIIKFYLSSANLNCINEQIYNEFITCLKNHNNVQGILSNLSLYKAQLIADSNNLNELQWNILIKGDFSLKDIITKSLFRELLKYTYNNYDSLNQENIDFIFNLIENSRHLETALSLYYIAKIYNKSGKMESIDYYFKSALKTKELWLLKAIWNDIENTTIPVQYNRYLTIFYFEPKIINLIKFSNYQIIETTNSNLIYYDSKFFIENNDWDSFIKILNKGYSYFSQNLDDFFSLIKDCYEKKQYQTIHTIMKTFSFLKINNANIWKIYLKTLENLSKENFNLVDLYFDEILNYIQNFHYDIEAYDLLMDFLLIKIDPENPEKFQYRDDKYWQLAFKKIPYQTEAGRFFYWLYRYYKYHLKNHELANMIVENFYYYAPGSYYIQVIWDEIKGTNNRNFTIDWNFVNSLSSYYRWIVFHGYKEDALYFLSKKNLLYFYNPKAIELNNFLTNPKIEIPEEILFLFKIGEYEFGLNLFKDEFKSQFTEIHYLKFLIIAGQKSENKFIEVYFLRELLRKLNIPEDPFTLPSDLLNRLYPRPYRNVVIQYSKQYNLSEDHIFALMRQESMFREDAQSRSGALGLMQIMPKTGKWLASKMGINEYNLLHPQISIQLGAKFYSDLLKMYNYDFRWASIAYNGGPGNLKKWKKKYYHGDFNYFLEILPVSESRNYCRKTYQNFLHYKITRILYDEGIR